MGVLDCTWSRLLAGSVMVVLLQAAPGVRAQSPEVETTAPAAEAAPPAPNAPQVAEAPPPGGASEPVSPPGAEAEAPSAKAPPPEGDVQPLVVAEPPPRQPDAAEAEPLAELHRIDDELRQLELARRKVGIVGPIAMTAGGFGSAMGLMAVAVGAYATAENIADDVYDRDYDLNDDGFVDGQDEDQARKLARITAGVASVGLAVGVSGTVWLARRLAQRSRHAPDIRGLKERRRELLYELRYGADLSAQHMALTLHARF